MSDDHSENVSTVPADFEFRSDFLSYSLKKQWIPVTLYYSYLVVVILGIFVTIYGIATGQLVSLSNGFCFKNVLLAFVCIALYFNASMLIKVKRVVSANREESSRKKGKKVIPKPLEFKDTNIESFKLFGGWILMVCMFTYYIFEALQASSRPDDILLYGLYLFFDITALNIFLIFTFFYEQSYRLTEKGFCFEQRKLFWKKTRKFTPLNKINKFLLKTRVKYSSSDSGAVRSSNSTNVYYFVHLVTSDQHIKILEFTESEKDILEWFVSSGNKVISNLTGRELNVPVAPSKAPNPAIADKSSEITEDNFKPEAKNDYQLNALSNNTSSNTQPIPSGCELGKDYLSYSYQASLCSQILPGILAVITTIVSICLYLGVFSINFTINNCSAFSFFVTLSFGFFVLFFGNLKNKQTIRLDENGFHLNHQSLLNHETKDIPINSILGFRMGSQEVRYEKSTDISHFVEIVTSEKSVRFFENDANNQLREWIIDAGNALLPILKKKAEETQKFKEKVVSDYTMDVSDFNDNND